MNSFTGIGTICPEPGVEIVSLAELPPCCPFAPRCRDAIRACTEADPPNMHPGAGVMVRCLRATQAAAA